VPRLQAWEVHIVYGAVEEKPLSRISLFGSRDTQCRFPPTRHPYDLREGVIGPLPHLLSRYHTEGVRNHYKRIVAYTLASDRILPQSDKLRGDDGHRGDRQSFQVELVNYQP
jgi:hypothetical protein